MTTETRKEKVRRILLRLLAIPVTLALLALLWLVLIVGNPQPKDRPKAASTQAPVTASQSLTIGAESDLYRLMLTFPAPVLSFLSGSGMTFVSGTAADVACETGLARQIRLEWKTPEGYAIELYSVYPANAVPVMGKGDYSFSAVSGPVLSGTDSVRMENKKNIRLHIQTDDGLYYAVFPKEAVSVLGTCARSLQLFSIQN